MALSKVQIANMALSHIGARSSIESFTEESSEARLVNTWYEFSRKQALEMSDWNFARKRAALVAHAEAAPEGVWTFRYVYPADCVSARKLQNPAGHDADAVPFEVEADATGETVSILTDMEDAILVYTYDLKHPSMFSPFFVELLSHILASHIAFSITGKRSVVEQENQAVQVLRQAAPAYNANERVGKQPRNPDWIRARA